MKSLLPLLGFLALGIFAVENLEAYNFLYIHPTSGKPVVWDGNKTIQYWLDAGALGRLTNDQAHTLVKEAMKVWENASPEANVPKFEFAGYLPEDVNGTNYQKYVSLFPCYADNLASCSSDAQKNLQTVIIFDEDGSILDNELCKITPCSANGGAKVFHGSGADPQFIAQGILVLGRAAASEDTKISALMGQIVHELGHLLGLAHTSINQEFKINDDALLARYSPSMFIWSLGINDINRATLNPDDIAGISVLYPSDTFNQTATIRGEIRQSDGASMPHANVIARNIDDPMCEAFSFITARSCNAAPSSGCIGEPNSASYEIRGLPPGTYTVEVEEVADKILARTLAPGLLDPFIFGDAEFWNDGDAASESNTTSSVITLAAGETRENINIILNRSAVTDDRVKYLPLSTFTPGPGTRCPEKPPVNYAELIGIEEANPSDTTGTPTPVGGSGGCSLISQ